MLRESLEYMLQMFAVQLKILLTAECKVVDNACTFLLGDHLNLLSDSCFQCSNGMRVALVDFILEESPEKEI